MRGLCTTPMIYICRWVPVGQYRQIEETVQAWHSPDLLSLKEVTACLQILNARGGSQERGESGLGVWKAVTVWAGEGDKCWCSLSRPAAGCIQADCQLMVLSSVCRWSFVVVSCRFLNTDKGSLAEKLSSRFLKKILCSFLLIKPLSMSLSLGWRGLYPHLCRPPPWPGKVKSLADNYGLQYFYHVQRVFITVTEVLTKTTLRCLSVIESLEICDGSLKSTPVSTIKAGL